MAPANSKASSNLNFGLSLAAIFVLLFLTITVLTVTITKQKDSLTTKDIAAICGGQVQTAVLNGVKAITDVCEPTAEPEPSTNSVISTGSGVGFEYPLGWSVITRNNRIDSTWTAQLTQGYFNFCEFCDGPFVEINLRQADKTAPEVTAQPNFEAYINSVYSSDNAVSNVSVTKTNAANGTQYVITGHRDGLFTGDFEAIYFEGSSNWAMAEFIDARTDSQADNEAWNVVKNSLDFSEIN